MLARACPAADRVLIRFIDPVCRCTLVRANPEKRAQGNREDAKNAASPMLRRVLTRLARAL